MRRWVADNWQWLTVAVFTALGSLGTWWPQIIASEQTMEYVSWAGRALLAVGLAVAGYLIGSARGRGQLLDWAAPRPSPDFSPEGSVAHEATGPESRLCRASAAEPEVISGAGIWQSWGYRASGNRDGRACGHLLLNSKPLDRLEAEVLLGEAESGWIAGGIGVSVPDKKSSIATLRMSTSGRCILQVYAQDTDKGDVVWEETDRDVDGWHQLVLQRTDAGYEAAIDGTVVCRRTDPWPDLLGALLYVVGDNGENTVANFRNIQMTTSEFTGVQEE